MRGPGPVNRERTAREGHKDEVSYTAMAEMSTPNSPLPGHSIRGLLKFNQPCLESKTPQPIFVQLVILFAVQLL